MVNAAADRIYVQHENDWSLLRDRGLTTVVDPMVFRTGDVFLRGRKRIAAADPQKDIEAIWNALKANIGSLTTFFDMIVLRPQLPIFDYESTFPVWDMENWQGRAELIDMCNQDHDQVLVPVTVGGDAYAAVKDAATSDLALDIRPGPGADVQVERQGAARLPSPQSELGRALVSELSAFDYEWRPQLPGLEQETPDSARRALATFMFGGLLFGGYAQLLGGDHLLQPGRSKLFLALALRESASLDEDSVFARAFPVAKESPFGLERVVEMPRTPTVLPYLLTFGDRTPEQLLKRAMKLRKDAAVQQLGEYLSAIGKQLNHGFLSPATEKELTELGAAARSSLRPKGDIDIDLELRLDAAVVPGVGIGAQVNPARLWGWFLSQLPSRRYRKLLTRMVIAQRSYVDISRHVKDLWNG